MRLTEAQILDRLTNPAACITLSEGNSKLEKTGKALSAVMVANGSIGGFTPRGIRVVSFNVPAGEYTFAGERHVTCPGAGDCKALCYANQGTYNFPMAKAVRILNHRALLALHAEGGYSRVADVLDAKIKALPAGVGIVRIHDSGDFFARWYVDAWIDVIRRNPRILFYAYTKSHPLFKGAKIPKNFRLVYSEGGKWDATIPEDRPVARIFATDEIRKVAGYVDGIVNDIPAIVGERLIGLVYHGVRKLRGDEVSRWT